MQQIEFASINQLPEISPEPTPAWIDPTLGKILLKHGSPLAVLLLLIALLRSLTRFIQVCKEN